MTVQEYLEQTWDLNDFINIKLEECRQLRELATNTVSDYTREYITGGNESTDKVGTTAAKIADLEKDINAEIDKLVALKKEIREVIENVPDPVARKLLGYRYLNFLTWSKVAEKMGCCEKNVYLIHSQALKQVIVPKVVQ